jgi:hypothetical protein
MGASSHNGGDVVAHITHYHKTAMSLIVGKRKDVYPMDTESISLSSSALAIPTRKTHKRFSFPFYKSAPTFDLDPQSYQDSPIFIQPPPEDPVPSHTNRSSSADSVVCAQPKRGCSTSQQRGSRLHRATMTFGAVELQGHLSNSSLEAIAQEFSKENASANPRPAATAMDLERPSQHKQPEHKRKSRLFGHIPVVRRRGTLSE